VKLLKIFSVLFISFLILGCNFNVNLNDIQDIKITAYKDNEKNLKLAEALMYYDPLYFAHNMNSFDENTSQGIKIGYFVSDATKKVSFRITYNLRNSSVSDNIDKLKKDFESFIPKLVAMHTSKQTLFDELQPKGKDISIAIFSGIKNEVADSVSSLLLNTAGEEQLSNILDAVARDYGAIQDITFLRSQFYQAFDQIPESVSLFYKGKLKSKKSVIIRISYTQENQQWMLLGFKINETNS